MPSAWNVRESSFGPVMMLTPGMVMHHCKVQNLKEIIPGKQKQALEGGRKLMLKHYFPDFKKKPWTNKSSSLRPMNTPIETLHWNRNDCSTAGIPVNAPALISRISKSRKGIKILIGTRVLLMPDSCIKILPKMPELRHIVFCAAHQMRTWIIQASQNAQCFLHTLIAREGATSEGSKSQRWQRATHWGSKQTAPH